MKKSMAIAAAISLAALNGASAQEPEATEAAEGAQSEQSATLEDAAPEEELSEEDLEVVCRTERITGSLVRRRRTCMTRYEWAELERETARGLREFNRGASGAPACMSAVDAACGGGLPGGSGGPGN